MHMHILQQNTHMYKVHTVQFVHGVRVREYCEPSRSGPEIILLGAHTSRPLKSVRNTALRSYFRKHSLQFLTAFYRSNDSVSSKFRPEFAHVHIVNVFHCLTNFLVGGSAGALFPGFLYASSLSVFFVSFFVSACCLTV